MRGETMASDKFMKRSIAVSLIVFTIIQVFYFAHVDMIPSGALSSAEITTLLMYAVFLLLVVGLSMLVTYILPIICVIKVYRLFVILKQVELPSISMVRPRCLSTNSHHRYIYKRLQVIRC